METTAYNDRRRKQDFCSIFSFVTHTIPKKNNVLYELSGADIDADQLPNTKSQFQKGMVFDYYRALWSCSRKLINLKVACLMEKIECELFIKQKKTDKK